MANTNVTSIGDSYMDSNSIKNININRTISGMNNVINHSVNNSSSTYAPSSGHGVAAAAALAGRDGGGVQDDGEALFPPDKKKNQLGNTAQIGAMLWTGEGEQASRGGGVGPLRDSGAVLRQSIDDGFRGGEAGARVGVGMGDGLRGLSDLNALQQMYLSDSKDASAEGRHLGVSQSGSTLAFLSFFCS